MKKTAFIGFDGYIDQILRPISSVQGRSYDYFTTISDMGQYIIGKGGKSCSIQLDRVSSRLGGNGPIFGRTLKQMGINVNWQACLERIPFILFLRSLSLRKNYALFPIPWKHLRWNLRMGK